MDSPVTLGDAPAPRSSVPKVTVAAVALVTVSAATLYIWGSVVLALVLSGEAVATIIVTAILMIGVPTAACLYVVGRMVTRHDLGIAYRLAWICLPVLALGIWVFVCILSLAVANVV